MGTKTKLDADSFVEFKYVLLLTDSVHLVAFWRPVWERAVHSVYCE